ncbi:hypothetical protein [Novosphingobium album (ex Liu et al. 2023)]|uniref:hypothetical protein n=1 Tax=Novosphingobium album (ex Liu et al. 2023) TaxID=3031130 RepID=UPI0023B0C99A|nr:hypothetical protein [Novosphingobium album (ex Liu et al. 2023)]
MLRRTIPNHFENGGKTGQNGFPLRLFALTLRPKEAQFPRSREAIQKLPVQLKG